MKKPDDGSGFGRDTHGEVETSLAEGTRLPCVLTSVTVSGGLFVHLLSRKTGVDDL